MILITNIVLDIQLTLFTFIEISFFEIFFNKTFFDRFMAIRTINIMEFFFTFLIIACYCHPRQYCVIFIFDSKLRFTTVFMWTSDLLEQSITGTLYIGSLVIFSLEI
jgi:hypothetical protein